MEQNRKAGQNPPRVVAPTEEEEEPTSQTCNFNSVFRNNIQTKEVTKDNVQIFEISMAVTMKNVVFWVVTSHSL